MSAAFEIFKTYVLSRAQVSDDEFAILETIVKEKKLRKRQYLLQEGDVAKYYCFITKGLLRTYSVDEKGNEHIIRFAMENWWISDRESLLTGQPSTFNIDAIEDAELILIDKKDYDAVIAKTPAFEAMVQSILNKSFSTSQNRIRELISNTAEEKYRNFVERYPAFALRVPQAMIASFLGITPETLSRLRGKKH
jgi:CRP-like cAMP-binding protein